MSCERGVRAIRAWKVASAAFGGALGVRRGSLESDARLAHGAHDGVGGLAVVGLVALLAAVSS